MSYRTLLQNRDFQEFLGVVRERLKDQIAAVRSETDTTKLYRAQGAADALESLLDYPGEEVEAEQREAEQARAREEDEGE